MRKILFILIILSVYLLGLHSVYAESTYSSNETTISSGGSNISGTNYESETSISQMAVGNTSSSNYEASFGFFHATQNNAPVCSAIPNQTWNQDTSTTINLSYYISDEDGDNLTFSNNSVSDISISIIQATGVATLTPETGFYGERSVIFSATDDIDMTDCNNVTLTVSAVTPTPTPSGGGGGSTAKAAETFTIDKDLLHIKLVQGKTQREFLAIKNIANTQLSFVVDTDDLKDFVVADEYAFDLNAQEEKTLKFDFFASEKEIPDVYTGRIAVKGGGVEKSINTIIDVISKEALFDVSLNIFPEDKELKRGNPLRANISLINLGDLRGVDIELEYVIKDMQGKVISSQHETIGVLGEKLSLIKEFDTNRMKPEDYVLYVRLTFRGAVATSSDIFTITGTKVSFIERVKLFFMDNYFYLIILLTVIIAAIIFWRVEKYMHENHYEHKNISEIIRGIIKKKEKKRHGEKHPKLMSGEIIDSAKTNSSVFSTP